MAGIYVQTPKPSEKSKQITNQPQLPTIESKKIEYCYDCGASIPMGSKFCKKCGKSQ